MTEMEYITNLLQREKISFEIIHNEYFREGKKLAAIKLDHSVVFLFEPRTKKFVGLED
jgi:hypothetical protein